MELAPYTTLRLGGPARAITEPDGQDALVAAVREADAREEPILLLAGGSNVVIADEGIDATAILVRTRGLTFHDDGERVLVRAAAGEPWDDLVARCVADGLVGVECLAGIPGSTGATPIQNVGAYGQEIADTLVSVLVLDRRSGEVASLAPEDCGFGYRTSALKRDPRRWVVLEVTLGLRRGDHGAPIRYGELARALGVPAGGCAPLADVRDAVLALRRSKGMVLDPDDRDTWSAGSFFTNPLIAPTDVPDGAPAFPQGNGSVKTSAAWLIEQAGFHRGYGNPAAIAISTKHTLALTNRGAGTTAQLVALAEEIAGGVRARYGIALEPEPMFVGIAWRL